MILRTLIVCLFLAHSFFECAFAQSTIHVGGNEKIQVRDGDTTGIITVNQISEFIGAVSGSGNQSYFLDALSDTSSLTPVNGDVAYLSPSAEYFQYENYWIQTAIAANALDITAPVAGFTATGPTKATNTYIWTFALSDDLAALEGLSSTGIPVRTASNTWAQRIIQGTTNNITVTNGSGVGGNPTIDLPNITTAGTFGSGTLIPVITRDAKGRITVTSEVPVTPGAAAPAGSNHNIQFNDSGALGAKDSLDIYKTPWGMMALGYKQTPEARLDIQGVGADTIHNSFIIRNGDGVYNFRTNGKGGAYLGGAGNPGYFNLIGNSGDAGSPAARLHSFGNAAFYIDAKIGIGYIAAAGTNVLRYNNKGLKLKVGATVAQDSCAILDIESTNQVVLLPRLTRAQRFAMNSLYTMKKAGFWFSTHLNKIHYFDGTIDRVVLDSASDQGIISLNTLTGKTQTFATGTSGTDFAISSSGTTHTFNIPTASATNRGLLSSANWSTFNSKIDNVVASTSTNLTGLVVIPSGGSREVGLGISTLPAITPSIADSSLYVPVYKAGNITNYKTTLADQFYDAYGECKQLTTLSLGTVSNSVEQDVKPGASGALKNFTYNSGTGILKYNGTATKTFFIRFTAHAWTGAVMDLSFKINKATSAGSFSAIRQVQTSIVTASARTPYAGEVMATFAPGDRVKLTVLTNATASVTIEQIDLNISPVITNY